MNVIDSIKVDEYSKNASYSNGKADLCGDMLEQFPDMDRGIRDTLFAIQSIERSRAIAELNKTIELFNKKEGK